ncbi:PREDICTED: L-type lectin-domain containing receptor kinase IX.1-like [Nelumbo nucifera]|uniref:non-specific serine/threonine protein kinase n=2 Tax=Nelumbo nucifera TaxID=4432 RepID=A0A1U8BB75_NELNU|nr:PREDICTED: L-type lectin-domain containing receptor kinase IX.1-like [Nelumbo nucifera]DAD45418.1 TPA_asm: hypothetical protein HUJ06_003648 [Nelumbo nucifera]
MALRYSRTLHLHSPILPYVLFYISIILSSLIPSSNSLSFNFSSSDDKTRDNLILLGDAVFSKNGVELTINTLDSSLNGSEGRVIYKEPVRLWDKETGDLTDFNTNFSFTIKLLSDSNFGDGLAFFLTPNGSIIPPQSGGGCLGLLSFDRRFDNTENQLIAVEFDTFPNDWDPDYNHVGIDVNSVFSVATAEWSSSNIINGSTVDARIIYNSSTKLLSVFFTYDEKPVSGESRNLSHIVDMRKFLPEWVTIGLSATTGKFVELHQLHSWDFYSSLEVKVSNSTVGNDGHNSTMGSNSTLGNGGHNSTSEATEIKKTNNTRLIVGLVVGAVTSMGLLAGMIWFIMHMKRMRDMEEVKSAVLNNDGSMNDEFEMGVGPKRFLYGELAQATNDFDEEQKLGEGGFGSVYRGFLSDLNLEVAVKRVSKGSKQGIKEYMSEVKIISQLRHKNLVQLVGWCHQRNEFLLVYEFMPNGSLDSHLFGRQDSHSLTWKVRHNIAVGLASGLLYLHEEWEQCVLHRDIKSSNVMLDSSFNAKLGDFGFARLVDHGQLAQTTVLAGTMGYMAPECVMTPKYSKESDVYSYGIVALEIACGRRPVEPRLETSKVRLVEWVWELYGRGSLLQAADSRLVSMGFDEKQMECLMVVGLWCAHPDFNLRPSIKQAMQVLCFEAPLPFLPPKMPMLTFSAPEFNDYDPSTSSSGATNSSTASLLNPR